MTQPFCFIQIAVKPHIKKYIQYQYRDFNFVCLTKRNFIGRKLYDLLLESKKVRFGGHAIPESKSTIEFALTEDQMVYRAGAHLTERATIDFNQFVEAFFYKDMFDFIEMNLTNNKVKSLIELFCQKLDISEHEITYDALIKAHQRHIENISIAEEFRIKRGEFSHYELRKLKNSTRIRAKSFEIAVT